jgi:hypothetical protein
LIGALALGCSHELTGPDVSVEADQSGTLCGDVDSTFIIRGSGLSPLAVEAGTSDPGIELPTICLTRVEDADGNPVSGEPDVCLPQSHVDWISQNEIRFRADGLGLLPGVYEVTVTNPDGTRAAETFRLTVLANGPLLFWVDPPAVYNGIATQITLYGSGLGAAEAVSIRDSDDAGAAEIDLDFTVDANKPNKIRAIVPSGTTAGTYDIIVRDDRGCEVALERGLIVTADLSLTVSAIDPAFGWSEDRTPVTITGSGFASIPRAYLNPADPSPTTVASALSSVAFLDADRLTAVVPAGLPAGTYDLIVVNPDGGVGLLEDAFQVTDDDPPAIDNVSPSQVTNDSDADVEVEGRNFNAPTVDLICRAPDGTISNLSATVNGSTATTIDATLPTSGLTAFSVCILRATNPDGAYADYSAVGITGPSSNLAPFAAANDMTTARRAPAAFSGRATRSARFIYAAGGDDGDTANALDTVESAPIDIFGVPGSWFEQPVSLPAPRTLAGVATIGQFVYLVGGNDGSGATAATSRALILEPSDAPVITDIAARLGDGDGLGAGVWYYRVSAVMADDDPSNPGGETLASDAVALNLPASLDDSLVITLFWDPVPGAKGYRVYRSPTPDLTAGNELLLAEIDDGATTSYEDVSGTPSGDAPLPLGATGVWVALDEMDAARQAAAVVAAPDPDDAATFHLYAIGGSTGASNLATVEHMTITLEADGTQTASNWQGASPISSARSELGGYAVGHADVPAIPSGTTYIYASGGVGSAGTRNNTDVAEVAAGGGLSWASADALSPGRTGYAALSGAGFLFAFGGHVGSTAPDATGVSAKIDTSSLPALINWNNEGEQMTIPRYLPGGVIESSSIYIIGGETTGGATASTERTVL